RPAGPEAALMIRLARDVEAVRILEVRFVAVSRDVPHRDLLTLEHLDPAEGDVARERAAHVQDGTRPPHDLLGRRRCAPFQVLKPPALLVRELRERPEPVADRVPRVSLPAAMSSRMNGPRSAGGSASP